MTNFPVPSSPIPSFDLGGIGQPLHFLHANGYPPACYKPLLGLLQTQYRVFGMLLRPLWPDSRPEDIRDWSPFSDDLLRFLASTTPTAPLSASSQPFDAAQDMPVPVIGVGHSIGAIVTLRAALRDPDKFKALVLIDPVLFVPRFLIMWQVIRMLGLGNKFHPLIPGAQKRRRTFDDLETVFRGYRSRTVFRYMSDENLRIYVEGMTRKTDQGYELVYSPEWEAHIYLTGMRDFDIWRDLPKLRVPTLFLRGAETDTFLKEAAQLVKRKQPAARVETLSRSTHILPLERPQEVFDRVQAFLKTLESGSSFPPFRQQAA
ncbi:MAG: alpha/beta hydrolase [Anaerolineales bacterium]|nr:alpha/beta hydrolase [Anaerolineales bacterium]